MSVDVAHHVTGCNPSCPPSRYFECHSNDHKVSEHVQCHAWFAPRLWYSCARSCHPTWGQLASSEVYSRREPYTKLSVAGTCSLEHTTLVQKHNNTTLLFVLCAAQWHCCGICFRHVCCTSPVVNHLNKVYPGRVTPSVMCLAFFRIALPSWLSTCKTTCPMQALLPCLTESGTSPAWLCSALLS